MDDAAGCGQGGPDDALGNPFTVADCGTAAVAVANHGRWMRGEIPAPGGGSPPEPEAIRAALAGRDLACWCAAGGPCHADLLLRIANGA